MSRLFYLPVFHSLRIFFFVALSLYSLSSQSATKTEIDAKVTSTLATFYETVSGSKEMVQKAKGVLVFPDISKAGWFLGGEYGEGALIVNGYVDSYYNIAGGSVGLQWGVQVHSQIVLFLTDQALADFKNSKGWEGGVDGSVAVATEGIGGQVDNKTITEPVIVYVFDNKGLMANVNLSLSKISKIKK